MCSSVGSNSGLCHSVLLLWRHVFAVDIFLFWNTENRALHCDIKKARMRKSDICTECNSLALPFQGINILPLCVHLRRSSYSGKIHSSGLLSENVVFSQIPLPLCHCTAILKVLSSLLGFLCQALFEHKCKTKHCDCKLDMTLPEEPAEGMESSQGMSVLWHRLREGLQCSVPAEDPLCWKLCPQHCSQAEWWWAKQHSFLGYWRYAAFLLDAV